MMSKLYDVTVGFHIIWCCQNYMFFPSVLTNGKLESMDVSSHTTVYTSKFRIQFHLTSCVYIHMDTNCYHCFGTAMKGTISNLYRSKRLDIINMVNDTSRFLATKIIYLAELQLIKQIKNEKKRKEKQIETPV